MGPSWYQRSNENPDSSIKQKTQNPPPASGVPGVWHPTPQSAQAFTPPSQIPHPHFYICTSHTCRFLPPPFSSPRARAIRQAPPKKRARHLRLEIKIQSKFGYVLGAVFHRFWEPTWPPKSTKIDTKSMRRCLPFPTPFFNRFGIGFFIDFDGFWEPKWSQVGSKMESKIGTCKNPQKSTKI